MKTRNEKRCQTRAATAWSQFVQAKPRAAKSQRQTLFAAKGLSLATQKKKIHIWKAAFVLSSLSFRNFVNVQRL